MISLRLESRYLARYFIFSASDSVVLKVAFWKSIWDGSTYILVNIVGNPEFTLLVIKVKFSDFNLNCYKSAKLGGSIYSVTAKVSFSIAVKCSSVFWYSKSF